MYSSIDPRSGSSVGEESKDKHSELISKNQDEIIQRLEKILEERKQAGDSGEHSPYRVKLTALDNSCVMFALQSQAQCKVETEEKGNQSFGASPLANSPLEVCKDVESEEERNSFRNRSLKSIEVSEFEEEK